MTAAASPGEYASGHLDVTVAIIAPPSAEVRAWLPRGLTLAPQTMTPAGAHPVMLMFGQHSHVRPWFRPPSTGGSYGEWIVATPFVEWTAGDARVSSWAYMSRLFLNSPWFVVLGWLYAYPKVLARVSVPSDGYAVRTLLGAQPRVDMQWQSAGPAVPWTDFPGASRLAPCFEQPFISRFAPLPWLGSRMWFDLERASVQPVRAHIDLQTGCAPGLPAMTVDAGSIIDGVPGAFRLSCDWSLSRPYLASRLPGALGERPASDVRGPHHV
jgi:hypothetical protein